MDIKSWFEEKAFKRAHIPTSEEALKHTPEGERVFYDVSSMKLGNLEWKKGWTKNYVEGEDPPFRTSYPWENEGASSPSNIVQASDEILIIQPKGIYAPYGVLFSNFKFKYGTVRALIKLPHIKGAFSAFWLFSGMPELDIFEHCGQNDKEFSCTHHWGCSYKHGEHHQTLHNERFNKRLNLYDNYYLFEVDVTPYKVVYKINGVVHRVMNKAIPSHDSHVILNVTRGDYCDSDESIKFDAVMHVKWIEVFNRCE